jgi:beta-phosphoglucomutase-like phosphatase (HAD superfamily)
MNAPRLPSALLLDLDGTLIDSEAMHAEGIIQFLRGLGYALDAAETRVFVIGRAWQEIYAHLAVKERFGLDLPSLQRGAIAAKEAMFAAGAKMPVLPGAVELALLASSLGVPMAIVSGSCRAEIEHALVSLGIGPHLEFYLGAEDYAFGKPAPDGYLAAAARLKVAPRRCLVVEDSFAGIASGIAAGMRVLATAAANPPAGAPGHQDQRAAHRVVRGLEGLSAADLIAMMEGA